MRSFQVHVEYVVFFLKINKTDKLLAKFIKKIGHKQNKKRNQKSQSVTQKYNLKRIKQFLYSYKEFCTMYQLKNTSTAINGNAPHI